MSQGDDTQRIGDILRKHQPRLRPPTKTEIRLIESAAAIEDKAAEAYQNEIAFHHAIFCQTALPVRQVDARIWERTNGFVQISIEAGRTFNPNTEKWVDVPLPFGPKARILMIHLDTQAIRKQSRLIDIDTSMTAFVRTLQGRDPTGPELRKFREQAVSISTSLFRLFARDDQGTARQANVPIVSGFELWYPRDERQRTLWPSYVELSEKYYETLMRHAVPLDHRAIAALQHNALALDIYKWLAQRLCRIDTRRPYLITWPLVQAQFGQGYAELRFFRRVFLKTLRIVLTQYPGAKVKPTEEGLTLYHSRPPIAPKVIAAGL